MVETYIIVLFMWLMTEFFWETFPLFLLRFSELGDFLLKTVTRKRVPLETVPVSSSSDFLDSRNPTDTERNCKHLRVKTEWRI